MWWWWELESVEVLQATEGLDFLDHRDEVEAGGGENFGVGSEDADEFLEALSDVVLLAGERPVIHEVVFIADEKAGILRVEELPGGKGVLDSEDLFISLKGEVLAAVEEHLAALRGKAIHPNGGGDELHSTCSARIGGSVFCR